MAIQRVCALHKAVLARLNEYRKAAHQRKKGASCDARTQLWLDVIEHAYALLCTEEPIKARLMSRLFGLEHPVPRRKGANERIRSLAIELCCSEATLYNWRDEIVTLVLLGGIEAGLIRLYDAGNGGLDGKDAV